LYGLIVCQAEPDTQPPLAILTDRGLCVVDLNGGLEKPE